MKDEIDKLRSDREFEKKADSRQTGMSRQKLICRNGSCGNIGFDCDYFGGTIESNIGKKHQLTRGFTGKNAIQNKIQRCKESNSFGAVLIAPVFLLKQFLK